MSHTLGDLAALPVRSLYQIDQSLAHARREKSAATGVTLFDANDGSTQEILDLNFCIPRKEGIVWVADIDRESLTVRLLNGDSGEQAMFDQTVSALLTTMNHELFAADSSVR